MKTRSQKIFNRSELLRVLPASQRKAVAALITAGKLRSHVGTDRILFHIDEVQEDLARLLPAATEGRGVMFPELVATAAARDAKEAAWRADQAAKGGTGEIFLSGRYKHCLPGNVEFR